MHAAAPSQTPLAARREENSLAFIKHTAANSEKTKPSTETVFGVTPQAQTRLANACAQGGRGDLRSRLLPVP